jgi:tRNA 2-thiouridine synthesizing protein C
VARLLVTLRHTPYGGSLARAAVDAALAAAAFEQPVDLLFTGAGVLNLLPQQDARRVGSKHMDKLLASLPLYDIDTLYVDARALEQYAVEPHLLPAAARLLDRDGVRGLIDDCDHLLGF